MYRELQLWIYNGYTWWSFLNCSVSYRLVGWLCWGLTSQSTIFQSCRDGAIASWVINQYFRGVKCLAQGHNTAAVGLEPRTSRSGVRHSTTEPRLSVKARMEPNQTEPTEIIEPAQPNLRILTDNYDYRYRVLAPLPILTLVLLTSSSLIISIIIRLLGLLLLLLLILLTLHFLNKVIQLDRRSHSVILSLVFSMWYKADGKKEFLQISVFSHGSWLVGCVEA